MRGLNAVAEGRGQTLAADGDRLGAPGRAHHLGPDRGPQRRTNSTTRSAPSGSSTFTPDELAEIDRHAAEGGINLWQVSSAATAPSGTDASADRRKKASRGERAAPPGPPDVP